jgi:syntaxin 8
MTFLVQQDELLDVLSSSIQRQKSIALSIGEETEEQQLILDRLDERSERSHKLVEREIKRVEAFSVKSSTCWLWIIILILTIVFCVLLVVAVYFPKTPKPSNNTTRV